MGQTAEQMASHHISREDQDQLTVNSHCRAHKVEAGYLDDEVVTAYPEPYKKHIDRDNTFVVILQRNSVSSNPYLTRNMAP